MRVAVHAFDGITLFHLAAPLLVFGEVAWETSVWTADGRGIRTAEGVTVGDVAGPGVVAGADLLVLPSWHTDRRPRPAAARAARRRVRARPRPG